MTTPLPTSVLALIAAMRCQALPWAKIAERVELNEIALRQQLAVQRDEFQAQMELAKADLAEDLLFAGLAKLQQLLNCGKQNIENDAAKALLRFHQNLQRPTKEAKTPKKAPPTPTPNMHPEPTPTASIPKPTKPQPIPQDTLDLLNFKPLPSRPPLLNPSHRDDKPLNTPTGRSG